MAEKSPYKYYVEIPETTEGCSSMVEGLANALTKLLQSMTEITPETLDTLRATVVQATDIGADKGSGSRDEASGYRAAFDMVDGIFEGEQRRRGHIP